MVPEAILEKLEPMYHEAGKVLHNRKEMAYT